MEFEGHECNQMHRKSISIQLFLISSRYIVLVFSDQNIHYSIVFCEVPHKVTFYETENEHFQFGGISHLQVDSYELFLVRFDCIPPETYTNKMTAFNSDFFYILKFREKVDFLKKNTLFKSENENQNLNQFEKRA